MAEAAGSLVGPYRIIGPIGSGGFATVYRARDERLESDVALKILAENHSLDADIRERFLAEARLLRRAAGRHIIGVLDIGETDRVQPFIVLEYAAGGDLRRRVTERRTAGERVSHLDIERVAQSLSAALGSLHRLGIVHRDVNPGNVLLVASSGDDASSPSGVIDVGERIVLADMGYAKDLSQHSGLTVRGGTFGFSAPEQRHGIGTIDQRADVYSSAGVVAWMLCGETPDKLESSPEQLLRSGGVSADLAKILAAGLATKADDRPSDIESFVRSVLRALGSIERPTPVDDAPAIAAVTVPGERKSNTWRRSVFGAVVAVLCVAAAGIWWSVDHGDARPTVTELDDGTVRVALTVGDIDVAIFGPGEVRLGEVAHFEAGIVGGRDYAWVTPDGEILRSTPSIDVVVTRAGQSAVLLLVTSADRDAISLEHTFTVTD